MSNVFINIYNTYYINKLDSRNRIHYQIVNIQFNIKACRRALVN